MRKPQKQESAFVPMNAITPRRDFARCNAIAMPPRDAPPRSGILGRIVDSIMQARQRREERELARRVNRYGEHLTDDVERRIFEEMTRNCNFRVRGPSRPRCRKLSWSRKRDPSRSSR